MAGVMELKKNIKIENFFCWNEQCTEFLKKGQSNIKPVHYDGKHNDILYLKCNICGKKFSENKGTIFFNKKTKKETIVKALKSTSEGAGIRATGRIFDVNKNTILSWVNEAGEQSEKLEKIFSKLDIE